MEPPNKGHIGTFQLSLVERLSSSRRSIYTQNVQLVHFCLSFIRGSKCYVHNGGFNYVPSTGPVRLNSLNCLYNYVTALHVASPNLHAQHEERRHFIVLFSDAPCQAKEP